MIDASRPGRYALRLPDFATCSTTRARRISRSCRASSIRSSSARSAASPPGQSSCGGGSSAEAAGAGGASSRGGTGHHAGRNGAGTDSRSRRTCKQQPPDGCDRPAPGLCNRGMDTSATLAATEHSPHVTFEEGMTLDCGARLRRMTVAYRTYGTLNAARSNAVLVCHALTGDQYVAEPPPAHRQGGLVGHGGRPRPADRHRPLLRHLRQCAGRLHGLHRPAQPARRWRPARGAPISRR